jgi:hypothetical protein
MALKNKRYMDSNISAKFKQNRPVIPQFQRDMLAANPYFDVRQSVLIRPNDVLANHANDAQLSDHSDESFSKSNLNPRTWNQCGSKDLLLKAIPCLAAPTVIFATLNPKGPQRADY